jgi:hypothetical protein
MVSFLICSFIVQHSPVYHISRACLLTSFSESEDSDHTKFTFTIPDLKSSATSCNLNIILISCGMVCIICDYLRILPPFWCISPTSIPRLLIWDI